MNLSKFLPLLLFLVTSFISLCSEVALDVSSMCLGFVGFKTIKYLFCGKHLVFCRHCSLCTGQNVHIILPLLDGKFGLCLLGLFGQNLIQHGICEFLTDWYIHC